MGVRLPARFGQAIRQPRVGRKAHAIRCTIGGRADPVSAWAAASLVSLMPLAPLAAGPTPPDSPTNGIACRSTASRLIRKAAVFCSATSRT